MFLGLLVAAVLGVMGTYAFATRNLETTDDAQVEADVIPIGARVGGQISEVRISDNQRVKKGALLVEIDDTDYEVRVDQVTAELETARAQAAAADAQVTITEASAKGGLSTAQALVRGSSQAVGSADAEVSSAQAGLRRAEAETQRAKKDLERTRQLNATHAVSEEALDHAQATADAAQAALDQAKAHLAAAQRAKQVALSQVAEARGKLAVSSPIDSQIAAAHASADLARARVKSAEAALELARLNLSYTKIVAPEDGIVSKLAVHEGQLVQPGQPVVELVPAKTYVVANFKETQISRITAGEKATIEIDAYPGRELEGRVESIAGGTGARFALLPPDNASGNFVKVVQRVPVRIEWTAPPSLPMRAGLSAQVTVRVH